MKSSSRRLVLSLAAAGLAATASMSLATAASAQPIREGGVFEETQVFADFCDVSGLTVQADSTTESRFMFNPHGPDGLGYGLEHLRITNVYTNQANGNAVTEKVTTLFKDLRVTDNGDGTLTILVLATGNAVVSGPDGKAIARNPGQVRFEVLIDNGGTPSDPSDDEFLEFLRDVKESTGRTDDFCEAVVPVLID
ncbi:MAG: hypothetical protein ACRD0V_07580 [Acidimicrobiales bacterium]